MRLPSGFMTPPVVTGGVAGEVANVVGGKIGEILVIADLMGRGYLPFMPVIRTSIYDVLAVRKSDAAVLRFEVRTGRRENGRLVYRSTNSRKTKHAEGEPDYYAVVVRGEPVVYVPELDPAAAG